MSTLSPLWRQRFGHALLLMQSSQAEFSWQEIAKQCAISSYHFLRMFHLVFHETPGQYQLRIRLQSAVSLLIDQPELSMTDIALECGYASSQSLAKALKKTLGFSGKDIRKKAENYQTLLPIINKLGHPLHHNKDAVDDNDTVENTIALSIPFKIIECPERYAQLRALSPPGFFSCFKLWRNIRPSSTCNMLNLMSVAELDAPASSQTLLVGYEVTHKMQSNHIITAGKYLHCRVLLDNELSYVAVWDAIFQYSLSHDIEISENQCALEEIYNPNELLSGPSDISFYIAIKQINEN